VSVPGLDAAFVIMLARDEARRRHVRQVLAREGVEAEVFPAVDGRDLTPEGLAELRRRGDLAPGLETERSRGQIGCALSHIRLLELILARGYARTLVLEDDAELAPGFRGELAACLQETPAGFDLLYLFHSPRPLPTPLEVAGRPRLRRPVYPLGTVGYVVSRRGAEKVLGLIKPVYFTIDDMLAEHVQEGRLEAYSVMPALVNEGPGLRSNIWGSGLVPDPISSRVI
jgi:GR25 family glycosyltransferase involved in LPS biosynthesis